MFHNQTNFNLVLSSSRYPLPYFQHKASSDKYGVHFKIAILSEFSTPPKK